MDREKDALLGLCQLSIPPPPPTSSIPPSKTPPSSTRAAPSSSSPQPALCLDRYALLMGCTIQSALPIPPDILQSNLTKEWEMSQKLRQGFEVQVSNNNNTAKFAITSGGQIHKSTSALVHAWPRMKYELDHCMRTVQRFPNLEMERDLYLVLPSWSQAEVAIIESGLLPIEHPLIFHAHPETALKKWQDKHHPLLPGSTQSITIVEARIYLSCNDYSAAGGVTVDDPRDPRLFFIADRLRVSFRYLHRCELSSCSAPSSSSSSAA